MTESLDETDWAILAELQQDGRLPFTELARRVNLSASATTERVRRLEAAGVITGYRAEVDLERTGHVVLAVVRLKYPGPGTRHEPLRRLVDERPEILECLRTTGDDCYVLKVATTSMGHLEEVVDALAQFGSTTTNLVLSRTLPFRGPGGPGAPRGLRGQRVDARPL
ncbi:Lrp/AsnC family transcriptional regulator [Kitasatospora sp. NPDC056181]|uniref:Lrp/AsnC family transcriptional regulator n=1 Tax=Kitasatospora sp. NPDC056181 TaxID=3345737 RepID=UPI0035DACC40